MTFRKLLMLLAAVSLLLVCLAGCNNNAASEDPSGDAITQTDPTDTPEATDAPTDPTEPEETEPPVVMGTVTHDNLNVRSNPSTDSTVLSKLYINTRVVIIEQKIVGDVTWGRIADGWINLNYVLLDGEEPAPPTEPVDEPDDSTGTAGTITASELNIRKSGSASSDAVGKYKKGDKVVILEVKGDWGRTDKGWISMKYVKTEATPDISDKDDKKEEDNKENSTLVTDGKTTVLGYVEIETSALYVRYGPGTKYAVAGKVYEGDRHAYYQEKNGWARIKDGWISLAYTDQNDDKDDNDDKKDDTKMVSDGKTTVLGHGIITSSSLNARYGPGTSHDVADKFSYGQRVAYYQKDGNWVRTEDGWISLTYVYVEGNKGDGAGSGTITGDSLNVRTGPGTGFNSVGKLNSGDKVDILAQIKIGDTTWGYTGKGWVSMQYVKMN